MKAILALANGQVFEGVSQGVAGSRVGELVFNTTMSGYQEVMTDPSYAKQVITFTYPMFGNVGINLEDNESSRVYATGVIFRRLCQRFSNWRAHSDVKAFFQQQQVLAISDVDTRYLTHCLRETGTQQCCLSTELTTTEAMDAAVNWQGLSQEDLSHQVSCTSAYEWQEEGGFEVPTASKPLKPTSHIVVYDLGVKHSILRTLSRFGAKVSVVPANTTAEAIQQIKPDAVVFSNGPGDPRQCQSAVAQLQHLLESGMPVLGICLGCQLLGLALGASIVKMKFGHHGANHPVAQADGDRVNVTSQNHGFMLDEATLPSGIEVTHRSLFDGSIQGIAVANAHGYQGHPEAGPGPHDWQHVFASFLKQVLSTH